MIRFLLVFGIAFAAWWFGFRDGCGTRGALACPPAAIEEGVGTTLGAGEVCAGGTYLCAELGRSFQVMRWPLDKGRLRVRIPLPDFVDEDTAKQIREAAARGIMAWDRHPFPIVVETGRFSLKLSDMVVAWSQGAGAGHAALRGNPEGKRYRFYVDALSLVVPPISSGGAITISPSGAPPTFEQLQAMIGGEPMGPALLARIEATAMHEMGHALGLRHSDSADDIMFREFRAGATQVRASSRDIATVEALYSLPNGAMVQ